MPTPFTHLVVAQQLLEDGLIDPSTRRILRAELPAFLLGNIAADARNEGDIRREDTHFYVYEEGIPERPWRTMLRVHPELQQSRSRAQQAFLAGYVAHLSMDEIWTAQMLAPHFVGREWGPRAFRFLMLHILLISMDERDLLRLDSWQADALARAQPLGWLPFLSDSILADWRDFIGGQIQPGGNSQTLEVFGERIKKEPEELRFILDSPETMARDLWAHIPPPILAATEAAMYGHAREQMGAFWSECGGSRFT